MSKSAKKWLKFALRWGIAVAGIWYVVAHISWRDRVLVLDQTDHPVEARLAQPAEEGSPSVFILDAVDGKAGEVPRGRLVNQADRKQITIRSDGGVKTVPLLAVRLTENVRSVRLLLIEDPNLHHARWISPGEAIGYQLRVPYPLVQRGLKHMLARADPQLLWAAVLIFPVTFLITSLRWHLLLRAVGINIGMGKAFVVNMVGAFYNTFMPGSTGGDVLKAYYASKLAPNRRTRAVLSVVVDRAIGLLALIILGGTMAAYLARRPQEVGDAAAVKCVQVALAAGAIMLASAGGLVVFYTPALRRITGLDFVLRRMPMQTQVAKAIETMELYRRRPMLVLAALLMTFPVHITVICSAMLAGMALGLPLSAKYYWVVVPVVVLVASIPISPQGAGVMEVFAVVLTSRQGCTVSQAFALTMSIRLVQIMWNLTGGILVLRGGYHSPTEKEQESMELSESVVEGEAPAEPVFSAPPDGSAGASPSKSY